MRYAGINKNDVTAGAGICVTLYVQGYPHHCPGCHNPETWSFKEGKAYDPRVEGEVIRALTENGVVRNLAIQGGEPLCDENAMWVYSLLHKVKKQLPEVKIYIWSGNYYEELLKSTNSFIGGCLRLADVLIDGPYIEAERDITLPMRGSRNQRIINLKSDTK